MAPVVPSLSFAAMGVFSSEASLTNRGGKFELLYSARSARTGSKESVGGKRSVSKDEVGKKAMAATVEPSDPMGKLSPEDVPCAAKVESESPKLSPRVSDSEPDSEPDLLEGRMRRTGSKNSTCSTSSSSSFSSSAERKYSAEVRSLTAQLMEAREQNERSKGSLLKHSADVAAERKRRTEAEEQVTKMQLRCQLHEQSCIKLKSEKMHLAKENAGLERKVQQLRKGMGRRSPRQDFGTDRLAAQMAEIECEPLRHCMAEDRGALVKKLLLKWHPDKQPSIEHSKFATLVMQEMQNSPAWPK